MKGFFIMNRVSLLISLIFLLSIGLFAKAMEHEQQEEDRYLFNPFNQEVTDSLLEPKVHEQRFELLEQKINAMDERLRNIELHSPSERVSDDTELYQSLNGNQNNQEAFCVSIEALMKFGEVNDLPVEDGFVFFTYGEEKGQVCMI